MEETNMSWFVELSERIYTELMRAAQASGKTPAAWIQERLPKNGTLGENRQPSKEELAAADAALDACVVSMGHPIGTDNEQIDRDLGQAYGDDHADHYSRSEST
jgi:hypothetical protein